MKIHLKPIVDTASPIVGEGIVVENPISFLGDVDPISGILVQPDSEMRGEKISNRVLFAPEGRGSTVGSYILYALKSNGNQPLALVMHKAEPIIITGAVISNIPLLEGMPRDFYSKPRIIKRVKIFPGGQVEIFE
jgi:predicted aconitase with swiveling domain